MNIMPSTKNEENVILEADTVFLLMRKGFPISRNVRAQWMLEHLDTIISIQCSNSKTKEAAELEVASVLPKNKSGSWSPETSHQYLYKVTSTTSIIFLAHKYRMVFNLDLSPSLATVDIQHGEIVIDEVYMATKHFLESIIRPFTIPGSKRIMQPEIYVTIIAHTPFFTNPAQQVLVQGWLVTLDNVKQLTDFIKNRLHILEEKVACATAIASQQLENLKAENERLVGGLFEESNACLNKNNNTCLVSTSLISPESSFINMLRYGMLALTLLPEHSCAHMIIVSDGVVGNTDVHVLDSVIQHLRATTIACSFLHVGSTYHPHCADGLVPYQELLHFIARATLGTYMSFRPYPVDLKETEMNVYQKSFLCWQLYREVCCNISPDYSNWHSKNSLFYEEKSTQLLQKKQIEDKVTCTLSSLLCCRLREGYLIKSANVRDEILEICFVLLWKSSVLLEYVVTCPWLTKSLSVSNTIQYTITTEAPYEFLHDITCLSKKPLKSQYRQGVVNRFWATLTSLTESDSMLAHFSWFPEFGWTWYSVPDTIRSGMPVFYLSAYPSPSTVQLSDAACPQFGQIWQPVVSLNPLQWARWMHTQRVTLILSHDRLLPKHLHQANQSGRFQCVQSRQAAAVLYAMLKNWATFVLVENHTYVQFIYREADKPPVSFSLIRINCKALCVILNIAFAAGTEGVVRHNVVVDLLDRLSKLTLPNRPTEQKETPSCTIIHKSLEKILIRYERMPTDLSSIMFPDGTLPISTRLTPMFGGILTTSLSRYLYHNRWLWHVKRPLVQTIPGIVLPRLNITAIARILSTITKMRLAEGFNFTYSAAGIINMVLEVQMQGVGENDTTYPCIIQYILFPPHVMSNTTLERDSASEEDTDEGTADGEISVEDAEGSGDFQIISEIWIEPQCGFSQLPVQSTATYMNRLQYHEIPDAIARIDEECINALLTLEYLSLLSQVIPNEKNTEIIYGQVTHYDVSKLPKRCNRNTKANSCTVEESCEGLSAIDERICTMHFSFDTLNILPKCQQAELLFSMFADDTTSNRDDKGQGSANKILMDNFLGHMKQLHNKELLLTSAESQKFTKMLLERRRAGGPPLPFFSERERLSSNVELNSYPRWKCFIKGISTTHVIITILPASEKDVVRLFASTSSAEEQSTSNNSERNSESVVFNVDSDTASIENNETAFYDQCIEDSVTNADTQRGSHDCEESLVIPVYVYDCSLALLIDTLVDKLKISHNKDIYQDHTFKVGQQECKDFIELRSDCNSKPSTPEPKSEDSDNTASDQRSLVEHCKQLSLAHCHCYVVAVYKSLVLQQPLTYDDMEAAVEQCEETLIEINITNYLRSVCRHLSKLSDKNLLDELSPSACNDVEPLHNLIKEKFERIITIAFRPVPAHPEFYYCSPSWSENETDLPEFQKSDSEDEIENLMLHSINIDSTTRILNGKGNVTWPSRNVNNISKISRHGSADSVNSDLQQKSILGREQPLFLQLSCSVRFQSRSGLSSIPVKSLPTCFMEIVQKMEDYKDEDIANLSLADLKITLDIICLNLPREVLEISLERHSGLRATSFCSGSPVGSLRTESGSSLENNAKNELFQEKMSHLPLCQHNAISNLRDEIEWLLQDETATAFLDQPVINENVLNFVANHVSESTGRFSCKVEKVPLYFVYPSDDSKPKFISELKRLQIDKYCIRQEGNLFYFVKNVEQANDVQNETKESKIKGNTCSAPENLEQEKLQESVSSCTEKNNLNIRFKSQESHSDSTDLTHENQNTEDGCKESNTSENRFQWLIDLDNRKSFLPNFWLILNVENDSVNVYFHCRFLEIISPEVNSYWHTQKMLVSQIKSTCRRVNQYLLLQNLHKTSKCSELLETEASEDYNWKTETTSEFSSVAANRDSMQNFTPGMFRCRVVWKFTFRLHPRLKTGPGRSGLSRGIKALHGVLNRFAVNNRSNMFVYQENNKNVFYLRLHEQISDGKALQNKLSESDEQLVVSRSNSVVSLSQVKLSDNAAVNDTRPRVRSFSEKESNILNKTEDSIILMVHGISDAGPEVKRDLVQVLQNRLDDAVLEVLSVMLARNPMCKLTPADVHFIQPPKSPESIIRLSVQKHCTGYITALEFYLRQNILQFLYIPKYTDNRPEYHFQDYSQREGSTKRISESDIFLYNQSHSSGSKGIACIALTIAGEHGEPVRSLENEFPKDSFPETINVEDFKSIVSTSIYDKNSTESPPLIEFKIWKQGRVNLESLLQKLCSAVKHAIWDLVTEYKFLSTPLTEPLVEGTQDQSHDLAIDRFEAGEEGKLHSIYCVTLSQWFRFALEIGVPSVKRHEIILTHRHPISTIITELEALIQSQAPDTSSRAFVLKDRQPFIERYISNEELLTGLRKNNYSVLENEGKLDLPVYIPCDFSKDVQGTYTKCILIARNFHQWKASFSSTVQPELLIPKDQKLLQKFNPLILESNFVSRQRILLAEVRSDNITLYMYNWSKEKSEKLIKQTIHLGTWLSSRSNFFTNAIMQKLGIFHHRPSFSREHANSQYLQIMDMESLTKFSAMPHNDGKDWTRLNSRPQNIKHNQFSWNEVIGQTMRDVKPNNYFHSNIDPTVKAVCDLQDLRSRERKVKEDLNKLYAMWQNRSAAPNIPISVIALNTFKQYSRLIHFCHTPLLFLPSWRLQSAATRDHSLSAQSSLNTGISLYQQLSQQMQKNQNEQTNIIKWHKELCSLMLSEYKQYLHSLGFSSVQIESSDKSFEGTIQQQQSYYLKKSMLGGVLLFEIHLSQPFFIVKLHIIECSRLQTKTSSALVNQFMLSFVDACDKIKISMHLHSFTYDFHLRCIHSYIAGTGPWLVQQGYHLIHFLDDFNKYYSKAPNYARNLIYSDVVTIRDLAISGRTLYSYLLSHEKTYNMRVFVMKSDLQDSEESEYVLVSLKSTPLISYCDAQDTKYADDFDVVLIVSHLEQPPQLEKTEITLKYYLMLTSKRELYPKKEVENNKLGKFRTVYNVEKSICTYTEPVISTLNESSADLQEGRQVSNDKKSDAKLYSTNFGTNCNNTGAPTPPPVPNSPLTQNVNPPSISVNSSPHLIQIRQESINYLGYYSSHEQLMQQTIMSQANTARMHIMNMIKRGALQCRTHLLWNKLLESKSAMNYNEFSELCSLAHVEPLLNLDPRLRPFINQPISWYQSLSKVLQNKYQEHHKQFNTPDGNITHLLILHPSFFQVFMMLTIDLHASRGDLYAVYCKSEEMINSSCCIEDTYNLIEGFVNACCFNLWMGLYN
ncbi:KICSTOR complex protein SZT2-like isoform X3 [Frieseomelitta varia]|uniref:KICSTOR complex protein SZT2-like isoform X3 n=1 Tax=Frieseomelitta varia TaxID=561572 RepID=UPI001CB69A3D|nr:KICSTOR complex protein SZT2-like isoform X3 [Frieseomelitta varia]